MGRNLTAAIVVTVWCLLALVPARVSAGRLPIPDGFTGTQQGGCEIVVPLANTGVVEQLVEPCRWERIEQVYSELGTHVPDSATVAEVRVVSGVADFPEVVPPGARPPRWAGALAFPKHDLIVLPLTHRDGRPVQDLGRVLHHELSHLALSKALDGAEVPRWFSEGVAIQQSEESSVGRLWYLWQASLSDEVIPLGALERYPSGTGRVTLAYAQAADFLGFLLRKRGWYGVRELIERTRGGEPFDDAFTATYGQTIGGLEVAWRRGFESRWGWLPLLTGSGALWGAIVLLAALAFLAVRRRRRRRLREMAAEEEAVDSVIGVVDDLLAKKRPPEGPDVMPPSRSKIRVDGDIHTLH